MADPFCSDLAREERAPLGGTATGADAWLLVENDAAWGERAVEENDLPAATQAWLVSQVEALGVSLGVSFKRVRPLFVRQEGPRRRSGVVVLLAVAQERRRELYRLEAASHEALAALDLAAMLAGGELDRFRVPEGLVVVCGNGRRDRCCARWGAPTYRELSAIVGESAWLSTHQGGHRYAGTGLWLPEGVGYGFLAPTEAAALVEARRRGAIHLPCFRGRTFHKPVVQAADAMLRASRGETALDPWRLGEVSEESAGEWRVVFESASHRHVVRLRQDTEEVVVSCDPAKVKPIDRFTPSSVDEEPS